MNKLIASIFNECKYHFDDVVVIRRDIHMYPEVGFDVQRTAGIAAMELEKLGMKIKTGVGKSGVVGDIEIPDATKCIALRADMDALPMQELGNSPYKSKIDGKAHMCGHDAHTAMLIGAARVISKFKKDLTANIRFIFQPNEESFPAGAPAMIEDGVLDGVDEIYGLHVLPLLESGQFAICPEDALAQGDSFEVEIIGKGGHGAEPHLAIDPVLIGCQFVTLLQSIIARNVDPLEKAVISATQIHGGTAFNVIPESVKISGTIRTLKKEIRRAIQEKMETMLAGISSAHGANYNFSYNEVFPVTYNHKQCVDKALSVAERLVDSKNVIFPFPPDLGSEDFAYYSQKIPACFISLGSGNKEKGIVNMCHNPQFDVDEECILFGMAMYASLSFMDKVI